MAKILFSDRLAHNFDARDAQDTAMIVEAFLPILEDIPTERLRECYVAALKKRNSGDTFQIRAVEILQAWQGMETARLLLPAAPDDHCWRCKDTRFETVLNLETNEDMQIPCQTCRWNEIGEYLERSN